MPRKHKPYQIDDLGDPNTPIEIDPELFQAELVKQEVDRLMALREKGRQGARRREREIGRGTIPTPMPILQYIEQLKKDGQI